LPAKIDPAKTKQIQEQALDAFRSLGLVVYGRVDILLSDSGDTFVLEVNNIPGMTEASLLPEAAAAAVLVMLTSAPDHRALSRQNGREPEMTFGQKIPDRAIDVYPMFASGVSSTCSM